MFKSHKLHHKTNNLGNLHKLCLREFPEYENEISLLIQQDDFIEMLEDFSFCQKALLMPNQIGMDKALYEQLIVELKQEMQLYILKNINQLD